MQDTHAQGTAAKAREVDVERRTMAFRPSVDIVSGGNEVVILADLPGAEAANIEVSFESGVLEVYAKVDDRRGSRTLLREEFSVGDYRRAFRLDDEFDGSKASADFHDGVLTLRIPKLSAVRPQRVQIRAGQG